MEKWMHSHLLTVNIVIRSTNYLYRKERCPLSFSCLLDSKNSENTVVLIKPGRIWFVMEFAPLISMQCSPLICASSREATKKECISVLFTRRRKKKDSIWHTRAKKRHPNKISRVFEEPKFLIITGRRKKKAIFSQIFFEYNTSRNRRIFSSKNDFLSHRRLL